MEHNILVNERDDLVSGLPAAVVQGASGRDERASRLSTGMNSVCGAESSAAVTDRARHCSSTSGLLNTHTIDTGVRVRELWIVGIAVRAEAATECFSLGWAVIFSTLPAVSTRVLPPNPGCSEVAPVGSSTRAGPTGRTAHEHAPPERRVDSEARAH